MSYLSDAARALISRHLGDRVHESEGQHGWARYHLAAENQVVDYAGTLRKASED